MSASGELLVVGERRELGVETDSLHFRSQAVSELQITGECRRTKGDRPTQKSHKGQPFRQYQTSDDADNADA
jgi:hypothetical protein